MQYDTKVDVKACGDKIFVSAGVGYVHGHHVGQKSKSKFRNLTNIMREQIWNFSKLIGNIELTLPPIIDGDCTTYFSWKRRRAQYPHLFLRNPIWHWRKCGDLAGEGGTCGCKYIELVHTLECGYGFGMLLLYQILLSNISMGIIYNIQKALTTCRHHHGCEAECIVDHCNMQQIFFSVLSSGV